MVRTSRHVRAEIVALLTMVALAAPASVRAYGWPLKPFDAPHPIRGGFDDPRLHIADDPVDNSTAFHFGVDIAAPDLAPVYAVVPGIARTARGHVTVLGHHGHSFSYWHVIGIVPTGARIRLHQLIGYVALGWGHVHFAERAHRLWVDPLRRGALTPYPDWTVPVVDSIQVVNGPTAEPVDPSAVSGRVGIVADAYDLPPLPPPAPWNLARLTPALIRWRLVQGADVVLPWRTAFDFAAGLEPGPLFDWIYAPGSYQNKPDQPGTYRFWLIHYLDTGGLAPGHYRVEVRAADTRGNVGDGSLDITVVPAGA